MEGRVDGRVVVPPSLSVLPIVPVSPLPSNCIRVEEKGENWSDEEEEDESSGAREIEREGGIERENGKEQARPRDVGTGKLGVHGGALEPWARQG